MKLRRIISAFFALLMLGAVVLVSAASAEDGNEVYQTTKAGIQGWVDCFPKAALMDVVSGGGVNNPKEVTFHPELLERAYKLGNNL